MKILVLGSSGMAGHIVTSYLKKQGYKVNTAARHNADHILDIEKINTSDSFFSIMQDYDFVINCIGLLVKDSIDRPDRAIKINSWWPNYCAHTLKNSNTKLIHLSTDCVFDGVRGNYSEFDAPNEKNAYGRSKAFGEIINDKDITFRMSIIGPELKNGTGLLHWTINNPDNEIPGWANAWWNGITTLQLAKCINQYISNPSIAGLYHLVNNNVYTNKYDLLCLINDVYDLKKSITKTEGPKSVNKILINTQQDYNFNIPDYKTMLTELRDYDPS